LAFYFYFVFNNIHEIFHRTFDFEQQSYLKKENIKMKIFNWARIFWGSNKMLPNFNFPTIGKEFKIKAYGIFFNHSFFGVIVQDGKSIKR